MSVSAAAPAIMVFDAQLVKGCNRMAKRDSEPIQSWFELFEAAQTLQERTKCATSANTPGQYYA